jgi:hypothetical protein
MFEQAIQQHLKVDFMGDVSWFLGSSYVWQRTPYGRLVVSITQTAKIEALLDKYDLADCNAVTSPYRSGLVIDRIVHDLRPVESKQPLVKAYQRLVGAMNWLSLNTRPKLSVSVSLLSRHSHNPSSGHLDSAKRALAWLGGTRNHGIRLTQGGTFTEGLIAWVDRPDADVTTLAQIWTDANWGPQDASVPKTGDTRTIIDDEV